jgi:hypothetical protein
MRILLVICCTSLVFPVYSQTKLDSLVDSIPVLRINRKELINTNHRPSAERNKDSFPRTTVQETMYQGRKIRVVTEYTAP